jgi:DNA-binding MarR family transcriptional regulator
LYLEATQRLWTRLSRELEQLSEVSMIEYDILVRLSECPTRTLRMSDLAAQVTHSRSRITHTVARMESRGLVIRRPAEGDGRGVDCTLTNDGFQFLRVASVPHVKSVRRHLFDRLDADQVDQLAAIMAAIAGPLRELDPGAPAPPPYRGPQPARAVSPTSGSVGAARHWPGESGNQ